VEANAKAQGALGVFRDPVTGQLGALVPSGLVAQFDAQTIAGPGQTLEVKSSDLDATILATVEARLSVFFKDPARSGARYAFFLDPRKGRVVVSTSADRASVTDVLGELSWAIDYLPGGPSQMSTRYAGTAPFRGGAAVADAAAGSLCSTGFEVRTSAGFNMLTTAGHCNSGTTDSVTSPGTNASMGASAGRICNGGHDMAHLSGSTYSPLIFNGGATSTYANTVEGAADPAVGFAYWWSGEATNENSTTAVSVTAHWNDGCGASTTMIAFQNVERDSCAAAHGDSGGAFYAKSGVYDYVRGSLLGGDGVYCYAEKWSEIRDLMGVTIVTF
jgi:hypothetical protein